MMQQSLQQSFQGSRLDLVMIPHKKAVPKLEQKLEQNIDSV